MQALKLPANKAIAKQLAAEVKQLRALPRNVALPTNGNGNGNGNGRAGGAAAADGPQAILARCRKLAMQVEVSVCVCVCWYCVGVNVCGT